MRPSALRRGLLSALAPRDVATTARAGTWLTLSAAVFVIVMVVGIPGYAVGRARWFTLAMMLGPLGVGLAGWRIPARVPPWVWSVLPFYSVWAIVGSGVATRDATVGNQIFLVWPVLYGAYLLRPPVAWATYAAVAIGDLILIVEVRPPGALANAAAVLTTLAVMTRVLITARDAVDHSLLTLSDQALRDPLTGLANRRAFDGALQRGLALSVRSGSPACLLAVDLDQLKDINDRHGHAAGDLALTAVAKGMRSALRTEDRIARLGGDEFAALLVTCPPSDAAALAERVRRAIASMADPSGRPLSVSIGVACYPDDAASAEELLTAADRALYDAKRSGRDCVRAYAA